MGVRHSTTRQQSPAVRFGHQVSRPQEQLPSQCTDQSKDSCRTNPYTTLSTMGTRTLHFHERHGENIELTAQGRRAERVRSFQHGILFSSRPLIPYELFQIEAVEMERGWIGSIRIGLTTVNPDEAKGRLPACCITYRHHAGTWCVLAGDSIHGSENGLTWEIQMKIDVLRSVCEGCRLGIMYDPTGRMYCTVNGEMRGMVAGGLRTESQLFAVVDTYGKAKAVQIAEPSNGE